jgi:FkbM family methyltransferase
MAHRSVFNAFQSTLLRQLSLKRAMRLSRAILREQGFGAGGEMESSGEKGVFRLIKSAAPVLFDAGAYIGDYTKAFLAAFPHGKAYVFEPSSEHLDLLIQHLGQNLQVEIFPLGLSDKPGKMPLYKDREISGLASLNKRLLDHINIKMDRVEQVSLTTVDSVVADRGVTSIDLLKIDVEGHELAVLRGAAKSMASGTIKLVQFEFGGTHLDSRTTLRDFFYYFKELSFSIGIIRPNGSINRLDRYNEGYELYLPTNFIAGLPANFQREG